MGIKLKFTLKAMLEKSDVVKVKEPGMDAVMISHFDHDPYVPGNYQLFCGYGPSKPVYSITEEATTLQSDGRLALRAHRVDAKGLTLVNRPKVPITLELYQLGPLEPYKLLQELLPEPLNINPGHQPG